MQISIGYAQFHHRIEKFANHIKKIPASPPSRQTLPQITPLIQSPSPLALIMHRRPPHISPPPPLHRHRPVQHTCIIPNHQIPYILPLHVQYILLLRCMRQQLLYLPLGFSCRQSFDVMHVRSDIQIQAPAHFMHLDQLVTTYIVIQRLHIPERLRRR